MNYFQATILALVQGATELLPVSSSGHLIIASTFLGLFPSLGLLTFLHVGTGLAILTGYLKKIWEIIKSPLKNIQLMINIVISMLPSLTLALLSGDFFDEGRFGVSFIAWNLIFWGVLMILMEQFGEKKLNGSLKFNEIKPIQAFLIGVGQSIALIPGTSRSGVTTLTGMALGLQKSEALDFAFIAGLPLILGAFFYEALKDSTVITSNLNGVGLYTLAATFIIGYLFIMLLQKVKKAKFLTFFGVYRIILGILLLLFV